jgi:hypothetical protein
MGVEFHHLHRKQAIEIPILREQDELHAGREGKTLHLKQFFAGCLAPQLDVKHAVAARLIVTKDNVFAYGHVDI